MSICSLIANRIKSYIDEKIDRESLNNELIKLHSELFEPEKNMSHEKWMYTSIIHWIAIAPQNVRYNDSEIEYVYKALIGEEGYNLRYTSWIHENKDELNAEEQKILEISRNYVNNYRNETKFQVFDDQSSYLKEDDIKFIRSLYSNKLMRTEFREASEVKDGIIRHLLDLLSDGCVCSRGSLYDTNKYVFEKINVLLSSYDVDMPVYCVKSLQSGILNVVLSY